MSGIELYIPYIIGGAGGVALAIRKYMTNKRKYKTTKEALYQTIKEGIENVDCEKIVEGAQKLKEFDDNNAKLRGTFDKLLKKKLPKMDKVEKMFNISKDIIMDIDKLQQKLSTENSNTVTKELTSIDEEEKKETEEEKMVYLNCDKIIKRNQVKHNELKQKLDGIVNINLDDIIKEVGEEFKNYYKTNVMNNKTTSEVLRRSIKKQLLEKQLEKRKQITNQGSGIMSGN